MPAAAMLGLSSLTAGAAGLTLAAAPAWAAPSPNAGVVSHTQPVRATATAYVDINGQGQAPASPVNVRSISAVPDRPITSIVSVPGGGYRLIGAGGGTYSFGTGDAPNLLGQHLNGHIVAAASTSHGGLRLVGSDGGIFSFNAPFLGSMGGTHLNGPIVGIATDPATGGYWLVGSDGGIFSFNAPFLGSMGGTHLNQPIVGIAATPTGHGYWLVARDGGVFGFGDARFFGSLGAVHLAGPIVGIAPSPTGNGYWLAGTDGGLFNFGDAPFYGSATAPAPAPAAPAPLVAGGTPAGATGLDISQYQCGDIPAAHYAISVVQVSGGGIDRPPNACYAAEAAWAGPGLQVYIYMNGLRANTPAAVNGPGGVCGANGWCQGYNFGWNWAQHWVAVANASGSRPHQWWLDVESGSGWTDALTNDQVIRGAIDALRAQGLSVGIYSSPGQWNQITGGMALPGIQLWVPGAGTLSGPGYTATQFCGSPSQRFAGGVLKYVQYGYTGNFPGAWPGTAPQYDLDYAC